MERTIRANDSVCRRKYLRDFNEAFRSYDSVLSRSQVDDVLKNADIVLVGDYHALPASQMYAAKLVERFRSHFIRPVALGLEAIVSRDQNILDEWFGDEIDIEELRDRIRFDFDWGYDWRPYQHLLEAGKKFGRGVYGLDCHPRTSMRGILTRDRHAAEKIARLREQHPEQALVVLFGESHLAPNHLPELLRAVRPNDRIVTVLQNIDPLYWLAAGEPRERVEAVRVRPGVLCVFTSTPLEKYEHYRLCLERWRKERPSAPDLAPSFYNLVQALLRFFKIDGYSNTRVGANCLVDLLPEVSSRSAESTARLLTRRGFAKREVRQVLERTRQAGSCYVGRINTLFTNEFRMPEAAEEAARFVLHACRDAVGKPDPALSAEDAFYARALNEALCYFGSRILYPARLPVRDSELYSLYTMDPEQIESMSICGYREFIQLLDFLVLHRDYEKNIQRYRHVPVIVSAGLELTGAKLDFAIQKLGAMLGTELYDAYLGGTVGKRSLRSLFCRDISRPGAARATYFAIVARCVRNGRSVGAGFRSRMVS